MLVFLFHAPKYKQHSNPWRNKSTAVDDNQQGCLFVLDEGIEKKEPKH
jgi:hypothetical protein